MISSPNRSARGTAPVRLVVIHTAEGALDVTALGNYFARSAVQASSHVGIDDRGVEQYVPYTEAAWTIRSANPISDNAELCGFAAWTRDQWITGHRPMLVLAAGWIRERCLARDIPIRKLTPAQVGAGEAGVIGHVDWTLGAHDGTHTDPGPGFPWDLVMQLATDPQGDWFDMATKDDLAAVIRDVMGGVIWQTTGTLPNRRGPNGTPLAGGPVDTLWGYAMSADGAAYRIEKALTALAATPGAPAEAGSLSDADKDDIAARVVALLGQKASA